MSSETLNEANKKIIVEHFKKNFNRLTLKLAFRTGTTWDAEDALMDAYERAIKYADNYDPNQPIEMWMSRIISNSIKDYIKWNRGLAEVEFDEELADGIPCEHYTSKIFEEIQQYISEQPIEHSEILNLYFLKGYKAREIAQLTSPTALAINTMVCRFRDELRKRYKDGSSLET